MNTEAKMLSFKADPKMAQALQRAAQKDFCSVAAIIRRAVAGHLQKYCDVKEGSSEDAGVAQ